MFCDKCGTELDNNAEFCIKCGNKITQNTAPINQEQKSVIKPMSKKKKIKLIVIAIIAVIIVVPILIATSASARIIYSLNGGDTVKAENIYFDNFDYGDSSWILNIGLDKVINNTLDKYKNSKLTDEEATNIIYSIMNMGIDKFSERTQSALDEISDIGIMAEAKELADEGDYYSAIKKYESISEDSALYSEAMTEIETIKSNYSENAVTTMEGYLKDSNIDEATELMQTSIYITDDNSKLMDKYCEVINASVNKYFESNEYSKAEKTVNNIKKLFPDEEKITQIADNLEASYEKSVLNSADKEFQQKNYEKAASIMETALAEFEDNTTFKDKYNEYKSYLPAFISELDYLNKNDYISDNYSNLSDNTGKAYKRIYTIGGWGGDSYAEYLINGNYTNFTGVAGVAYDERSTEHSKFFEVYGDGVLLYTSPVFKASSMPKEFNINVTGVKVLKIYYPKQDGPNSVASIFDGKLYNTNYINNTGGTETTTAAQK